MVQKWLNFEKMISTLPVDFTHSNEVESEYFLYRIVD